MKRFVQRTVARVSQQVGVSTTGLLAVVALGLVFVGTAIGFGGLTEDVAARNGQQIFDFRRLQWFTQHRSPWEIQVADSLAKIGAVGAMAILAAAAALLLWRRHTSLAVVLAPIAAFGSAAVAVTVTKTLVGRGRPPVPLRLIGDTEPSFPSGHTTATTAVVLTVAAIAAVVIARRPLTRLAIILGGIAFPAAVGVSRLVLGAHWPTDVVAGWLLGAGIASLVLLAATALAPRVPAGQTVLPSAIARLRARRPRKDRPTFNRSMTKAAPAP